MPKTFSISKTISQWITLGSNIYYNTGLVGIGATSAPTSKLHIITSALGVTQVNSSGIILENTTAAAAGAQQISPALTWRGTGWKTTSGAASQTVDFQTDVLPVEGAANPSGIWRLRYSVNSAAYATALQARADGRIILGGATVAPIVTNAIFSILALGDTDGVVSMGNSAGGTVASVVGAFNSTLTLTGSNGFTTVRGVGFTLSNNNSSVGNGLNAGYFSARNNSAASRANYINGIAVDAQSDSTGGTVINVKAIQAIVYCRGVGGTVTNLYGLHIDDILNTGTITNTYGVYIGDVTVGTQTNQAYGLYQVDTGARNFFGGNIGIGVTTPTAALHLKAGTATVSTAPLKLTAGTNLTTPENGAIEFDGTNIFITVGGVRKTFTII